MDLKTYTTGIQHIGIPTNDIEKTIAFYQKLGFEIALQTVNEEADEKVAFLELETLVIETYENKAAKMESGAIDHVAINVKDIEEVYRYIEAEKMKIEWGSQIRNYVLHPYKLIKDVRSQYETSDVDGVLNGELDEFLKAYLMMMGQKNNDE